MHDTQVKIINLISGLRAAASSVSAEPNLLVSDAGNVFTS